MLELDKQETMLILQFHIFGTIRLDCDKCLSEFDAPIDVKERQIVKFAEDDLESDDLEIIMLNRSESEIDVSTMIYEFITVSVPYIKICEENGTGVQCDQEMIERLNKLSVGNQAEEEKTTDDPRWEALKELKQTLLTQLHNAKETAEEIAEVYKKHHYEAFQKQAILMEERYDNKKNA